MREFTDPFIVRFKPGDRDIVRRKMKEAGINNMAAYIRKMAIDGYVVRLDLSDVKEVSRLLRINTNNINQYAKRANETGSIYAEDIKLLQEMMDTIWHLQRDILSDEP